jgi:hypothetical protein
VLAGVALVTVLIGCGYRVVAVPISVGVVPGVAPAVHRAGGGRWVVDNDDDDAPLALEPVCEQLLTQLEEGVLCRSCYSQRHEL